jgi:uncharacterized protein involved in oxidation of intracellular sulfur
MITFILNHSPYGNEKSYNALRLALSIVKKKESVQIFMMDDGILCALKNQKTPMGYYNIGRMIKSLVKRGHAVYT